MSFLDWLLNRKPTPQPEPRVTSTVTSAKPLNVSSAAVALSRVEKAQPVNPFIPAKHPKGIGQTGAGMAMDDAFSASVGWSGGAYVDTGLPGEGLHFLGYPYLAELAQRPEYRRVSETIAMEMTRRWIRITAKGEDDKSKRIAKISERLECLGARDVFRRAVEQDGFFGRAHVYIDLGTTDDSLELVTPIGDGRDAASKAKIGRGSLKGLRTIEAVWCYPSGYNTTNPLADNWYKPTHWYVQGRQVHRSRLLTFVAHEVPDLLKPAYSFGGLSMSQVLKPSVDNWLKTRESVSDLISSFSVSGVKIDMASALTVGGNPDDFFRRIDLFTNLRDNRNTMVLNKAVGTDPAEEFFNVSTPLGTLDHLQAQAQEHIASAASMPLVKFLGITPSGLNASSEGEIRVWYDWIHAKQEDDFRPPLTKLIDIIQLSEFGDIDPDIGFAFEPLWSLDETAAAAVRKTDAETDAILCDASIILPEEARKRVASNQDTVYQGLDLSLDIAPGPSELDEVPEPESPGLAADAAPRTLYLSRKVENASDIVAWAHEQGIADPIAASELHVTIAYSRQPIDWFAVGTETDKILIPRGGPRQMALFGAQGEALVLLFSDWSLQWRHERLREAGATWDHAEYQPHVTIAGITGDIDLSRIEPYQGKIVLGPEIFAETDA